MIRQSLRVVLAALLLGSLLAAPAQAADRVPCRHLDVGPAWSARPVVVCYGFRDGFVVVNVSTDRGRTWTEKRATGTPEPADHLFSVLVSPSYDTDRTIYLRYQVLGLFASADGGATFTPADPHGGGEMNDRMVAVDAFGPAIPGVPPQPAVALPRKGPAVFYRGQHVPVAGSGRQQDRAFQQLGRGEGSVVINVSQGPDETFAMRFHVARCTAELACPGGFQFPKGTMYRAITVDPAPAGRTAVVLMDSERMIRPAIWVSTDRGASFRRNAAFDRAVAPYAVGVAGMTPKGVAVFPGGREWLVTFNGRGGTIVLATTDAGRTWQPRARQAGTGRLVAAPDGRTYGEGWTFQCSLDRARTWHTRCPR